MAKVVATLVLVNLTLTICISKESNFLSPVLKHSLFSSCEVIFALQHGKNNFEVNFEYCSSTSSGVFVTSNKNNSSISFQRLKDVHKYNPRQCGVGVILASKLSSELSKWLFETLTPRYVPIIRKDEDHFVFVTKAEPDTENLLLSSQFGNKIKFKIGITLNTGDSLTLKTVNLSSEKNGEATIETRTIRAFDSVAVPQLFPDTTFNFHKKRFRVANPKAPFYFEMRPDPTGSGNIPVRGLYKVWLDVMMERFNFTIFLFQSSLSGGTGKRLKNGTWLGAVADVLSGDADMAIYIGHIYNRHEFVEWSTPLTYEWMVFITHKPRSFYNPSALFKAFPVSLWIGFVASLVLICATFKLIFKFIHGSSAFLSARKLFLYLMASFMEQDADYYLLIRQLSSIRVLVSFWLLFALILSTAYRAKLVGLIAFPAMTWVPSTFDDLAYSGYRVGVNVLGKGGAAYSVLSTSKSPVYQNLFNKMEIYPDPAVCMREGLQNNIGCIMWKSVADSTEAKNFTDKFGRKPFRASEQTTSFIADGYIWEKRAIFRHHFDRLTWSIVETGLSSFWFQSDLNVLKTARLEWERNSSDNSTDSNTKKAISFDDGPSSLKLVHLMGLGYIFIAGNICGMLGFSIEYIRSRHTLKLRKMLVTRNQ